MEHATQLLRDGSGKHFDPVCVDAFFADFDEILTIKNRFEDEEIVIRDRALD
jgi:putative two-component system response regulator